VDVTHTGIRNVPSPDPFPSISGGVERDAGSHWVASLKPGAEKSATVKRLEDTRATPLHDDQSERRAIAGPAAAVGEWTTC